MFFKKRKNKGNEANNNTAEVVEDGAKKPRYHITVVNAETGEALVDKETSAIIGCILNERGDGVFLLGITCCPHKELSYTAMGALSSIREIEKRTEGEMARAVLNACIVSQVKSFGWDKNEVVDKLMEDDEDLLEKHKPFLEEPKDDGFFS